MYTQEKKNLAHELGTNSVWRNIHMKTYQILNWPKTISQRSRSVVTMKGWPSRIQRLSKQKKIRSWKYVAHQPGNLAWDGRGGDVLCVISWWPWSSRIHSLQFTKTNQRCTFNSLNHSQSAALSGSTSIVPSTQETRNSKWTSTIVFESHHQKRPSPNNHASPRNTNSPNQPGKGSMKQPGFFARCWNPTSGGWMEGEYLVFHGMWR